MPSLALVVFPDDDIPGHGIYFVVRARDDLTPLITPRLAPIQAPHVFMLDILRHTERHRGGRRLEGPLSPLTGGADPTAERQSHRA